MSFSSFSYRSPKKFKATSSSTIRSTPSKSPTNEWNSYLTDDHKFRLSNDEIIKKKQLMISKHNILMSGTSNGAGSFNSSTSATTPTTSRSKTKAKTNTNTNANAKNVRQYSKKTKNNNFEDEDRDDPRTHKREAFTSLDLLTAEISEEEEEEEDEVTDEDDYQPVYQPHHKHQHHNQHKNQYHKNGKGVEEDKHHEQNSSGDEGDKEEETENIHEIYQNEYSKKKKIPSSRKSSKISSLSSSSFSSSTPRTTSSTSTKGSKTRQLSSQNKGIKTSSTQRPSPLTQSQQKDLQEIQQMIQSLHQELKYYEELSGRRSFLDVEELSSVVATGSADQGEGPGEGKDAMTSQLTTMRYLVQLVCQTMTYLLKSEIELNKQNENYLQLSTKINQLFYLYSQSQHSQHPQEHNLQYSNFKSYDSTQMTPPSHSNIHPPPPPPHSDISDRTIPLYSHGGTPSSDSHSAISTPSSFSEFSNNSSIMKKKNQVTFSLPNSGVSTATSTPRTEYSTPSMPFRESKLGTSSTDWLFQTTKDLLTQSTPTSNYNTYSPATSQQQQQLQQQSSSLSKDSNFITMNSNDRYERMTTNTNTNTNTNTPTTPSSPYSASVNNPPSFPSPSPSSSYPQQPNRLLELQQQIAIMKHDSNGINGHGHIKEATITPQSSSPFSAYHSDPLKQWLKWKGESPQPTRGLITTRAMNSLDDINNLSLHPPSAPSAPPPPPPPHMPSQPLSSSSFSSSSSSHYFESTKTIHLPRTQNLSKNIHEESDSETEKNPKKTRDEDEEEEEQEEEEEEQNQDEEMPLHQIYKSNNFLTPPTNRLSSTSASSSSSSSASKGSSHSHSHPPSHVEEEEPSSQHLLSSSLLPTPERAPQHPHTSTLNNIPLYPSSNKMKSTNSSPNMKFQRSYDARNGSYGMK